MSAQVDDRTATVVSERVRIEGHIIDSLILPKVLDLILREGGDFHIAAIEIGRERRDPSWAEIDVSAADPDRLARILRQLTPHGASPIHAEDCSLAAADMDGACPEQFYSTTNRVTEVRLNGKWVPVDDTEMDCAIVVADDRQSARCSPLHWIRRGELVVVGHVGVRVRPFTREQTDPTAFQFMTSAVSSERPKGVTVRDIASCLRRTRAEGKKILLVCGPAVVHTGASEHLCRLIRGGYVQTLFAGNALATHDIEQTLFGTSLGIHMQHGVPVREGHEHHLRAINTIRRLGGIRQAVERGVLAKGIMYECVRHGVEWVLAGSIRDDGPLPEVITDVMQAQDAMRFYRRGVGFCLMIATTLHSIATGNILPASVRIACVDINPATVTKLSDRGTAPTVGIVTDVEPFLRELVLELFGAES
jgi:lysine-ketoglutarate reductase/saccharopine dehydrogenase-like protein (TIGR00300 family)